MNTTDTFPPLNVEIQADGLINLTDPTDAGAPFTYTVLVHPMQLRWVAEKAGLLPEVDGTDAELLRIERERVARLQRELSRLLSALELIDARASQLHDNIFSLSQRGGEDMGIEVAQSSALADFTEHVYEDLKGLLSRQVTHGHDESRQHGASAPRADPAKTTEIGGVQGTQSRGSSASTQLELVE